MIPSTGGPFGSIEIDKKLEQLFNELFGKDNMDKFRNEKPKIYVKFVEEVIGAKCDFYRCERVDIDQEEEGKYAESNGAENYHAIQLKKIFYSTMKTAFGGKLKKIIKKRDSILGIKASDIGLDIDNKEYLCKINEVNKDYIILEIHKKVWKRIFDECCINPIIKICKGIINDNDILKDIKYIFMVGGLSKSKYFQIRMKKTFSNIQIIVPENPRLSVVCGAARYGLQTDFVHTRILKQTYAVRVSASLTSLLIENEMRKLSKYLNKKNDNDDNEEEKDDEMEEIINKIMADKESVFSEEERKNNDEDELRKLIPKQIESQLPDRQIPDDWIRQNVGFNHYAQGDEQLMVSGLLSVLVSKGAQIVINGADKITKEYSRISKDQKMSNIEIYCSDVVDPRRIDETPNTKRLCKGILKYPDTDEMDVVFELSFDDSLLIAYAYPKGKRQERAEVAIEYQTN